MPCHEGVDLEDGDDLELNEYAMGPSIIEKYFRIWFKSESGIMVGMAEKVGEWVDGWVDEWLSELGEWLRGWV